VPLRLTVDKLTETLRGPLILSVVPHPPRELVILGVGAVLTLAAAIIDRRSKNKSFLAGPVAVPCMVAILLLEAPHPLEVGYFLRMLPVAGLLGLVAAGIFTLLAKAVPTGRAQPAPAAG
jgi:hypothetical protein